MACCLTAPSHCQSQCWLSSVRWGSVAFTWVRFNRMCSRIQSMTWIKKLHFNITPTSMSWFNNLWDKDKDQTTRCFCDVTLTHSSHLYPKQDSGDNIRNNTSDILCGEIINIEIIFIRYCTMVPPKTIQLWCRHCICAYYVVAKTLTLCGLVTPYVDMEVGQHWLR